MAPTFVTALLEKRDYVCYANGDCRRRSAWGDVGRWVFAGIVLFVILVAAFSFSFIARRRRRRGAQPMYGTGWMAPAGKFGGHNQQMNNYPQGPQGGHNPQQQQGWGQQGYGPPPPAYGQPPAQQQQYTGTTGTSFNPNDGYYGDHSQQQHGVQQPPNAYHQTPADGHFSPPPGPPPTK